MTQQRFGDILGVAQPVVSQIETGVISPTQGQVGVIIEEFGTEPFREESVSELTDSGLLSNWLRSAMKDASMSIRDLAEKTGMSRVPIDNILKGTTANPRVRTIEKLEEALGITIDNDINAEIERDADLGVDGVGAFTDFDPYDWNDVPDCPGIYVFYDISDRPIYVGEGQSIRARCRKHEEKFWYKSPVVYKASYVDVPEQKLRRQIEKVMIRFMKSNAVINKQLVKRGEEDD